MKYKGLFTQYINDLAQKTPTPGGGSAGSLIFCIGVSLIQMAVNFSITRKNKKRLKRAIFIFDKEKEKIFSYIDLDGEIFNKVIKSKGSLRKKFVKDLENITFELGKSCIKILLKANKIEFLIKTNILSDFYIGCKCIKVALFASVKNMEANEGFFFLKSRRKINYLKKYLNKIR